MESEKKKSLEKEYPNEIFGEKTLPLIPQYLLLGSIKIIPLKNISEIFGQ